MNNLNEEKKPQKRINKKILALSIVILLLIVTSITVVIVYINNDNFRNWADKYILRKEITEENTFIIEMR